MTSTPPRSQANVRDAGGHECSAREAVVSWLAVADDLRSEYGDELHDDELWALRDMADCVHAMLEGGQGSLLVKSVLDECEACAVAPTQHPAWRLRSALTESARLIRQLLNGQEIG